MNVKVPPTLKRRLEFEDDEEEANIRMKRMDIEGGDNGREGTCD